MLFFFCLFDTTISIIWFLSARNADAAPPHSLAVLNLCVFISNPLRLWTAFWNTYSESKLVFVIARPWTSHRSALRALASPLVCGLVSIISRVMEGAVGSSESSLLAPLGLHFVFFFFRFFFLACATSHWAKHQALPCEVWSLDSWTKTSNCLWYCLMIVGYLLRRFFFFFLSPWLILLQFCTDCW
jgi:hypothetical protein